MNTANNEMQRVRTYLSEPSPSKLLLPSLSCDSHVHVFGPVSRFPFDENRKINPVDAPKETLFALHRKYGLQRCVIVQSVVHGFDNSVVEDAIQAGGGNYLGVALVPIHVKDAELSRLANAGFRGVRFNFMKHLSTGSAVQEVVQMTKRLATFGMHLQVHFESALVHELGTELRKSSVPVVIDHMGRIDARLGINQPDLNALMRLLEEDDFYVKISGIDRIDASPLNNDGYSAGIGVAAMLTNQFPDKCFWGTDWPHPNHTHIPDDGVLVDALNQIAPTPAILKKILVDNPQSFYKFG